MNIFDRIEAVLDKYGWHQRSVGNQKVGYCLMGAVQQAAVEERYGNLPVNNETMRSDHVRSRIRFILWALEGALSDSEWKSLINGYGVISFNDDSRTTLEDVKLLIKKAKALDEAAVEEEASASI